MLETTIAVLSDFHAGASGSIGARRSEIADTLLLRAVHRINRYLEPALTVVLGDLIDDGEAPDAGLRRQKLRQSLDLLRSPLVVLPGNHDGNTDDFYDDFPKPAPAFTLNGVRFLTFVDLEEPGWNARRADAELQRSVRERRKHDGPLVSLQHVPLFPAGAANCPYNYVNSAHAVEALRGPGISLVLSGHYHPGLPLQRDGNLFFAAAPALCETPFRFWTVTITENGTAVTIHEEALRMPEELGLFDAHVHSEFAYCGENMTIPRAAALADDFGLAGLSFAEHSAHLYWNRQDCGHGLYAEPEGGIPEGQDLRSDAYFKALEPVLSENIWAGMEADLTYAGELVVRPADRARCRILLAAVHRLRELTKPKPDLDVASDEFLAMIHGALECDVDVLAHPFRVFRRAHQPTPERLFVPVVKLLRESGTAAEINFHTNEPPETFVRLCLEAGVPLSLGSDSHNLYEVGEFRPHLELLERCGVRSSDLRSVLRFTEVG